jgi:hypothetical protein
MPMKTVAKTAVVPARPKHQADNLASDADTSFTSIVMAGLGVSASPSPARSSRAARLTWSRQPRGRPAGLPDRPFANRPRRCRTSCFPCFIWSRSGIGNSFDRNCTRLRVPTPRRLQYEYGDCVIIYLSNQPRANGQQADRETLIGTRGFIHSARSLPNSIEIQGRFASESACADYLSEVRPRHNNRSLPAPERLGLSNRSLLEQARPRRRGAGVSQRPNLVSILRYSYSHKLQFIVLVATLAV